MRTTVDIEPLVLERAKRLALTENRTLGAVLSEALAAYLGARKAVSKDGPFELLVCGRPGARFPTREELRDAEEAEDVARLGIPRGRRRGSP